MTLRECEEKAQTLGFDKTIFDATFPTGVRKCRWIDAYMGGFLVEGIKGVLHTSKAEKLFPDLVCENIEVLPPEKDDFLLGD